jgi:hypothetical protein
MAIYIFVAIAAVGISASIGYMVKAEEDVSFEDASDAWKNGDPQAANIAKLNK